MPDDQTARVEVFVDHSNFFNGLKQQFGDGRYALPALAHEVRGGRPIVSWNHYCGVVDAARDAVRASGQQKFHDALKASAAVSQIPLQMQLRPLVYPPRASGRPPSEKGIDALIVQDMIVGAFDNRYDVAVLLSGDRDFCNLVEFLKSRFPSIRIETYFANARRHLFDMKSACFDLGRVIDKKVYDRILHKPISPQQNQMVRTSLADAGLSSIVAKRKGGAEVT